MKLKKFGTVLLLFFFLIPFGTIHAQSNNAGFVPTDIWYSKDPFEAGDTIKVYTLIFNPDSRELSGTVNFYDNSTLLGTKNFTIAGTTAKDISIQWKVTVGSHSIFAKIQNAKFLVSAGKYENVTLAENQTKPSVRTVKEKIIPKTTTTGATSTSTPVSSDIQNVENTLASKTPNFIAAPIEGATKNIEAFRTKQDSALQTKKADTSNQIKSSPTPTSNKLEKPLKYIELFLLSALAFIFHTKALFYGILILLVFLLLRFIWRKIF